MNFENWEIGNGSSLCSEKRDWLMDKLCLSLAMRYGITRNVVSLSSILHYYTMCSWIRKVCVC